MGIEPTVSAWKANRLPLTDTRYFFGREIRRDREKGKGEKEKKKILIFKIQKGWDSNPWFN